MVELGVEPRQLDASPPGRLPGYNTHVDTCTHTQTHSQGVTCTPTLGLPLGSPPSHSLLLHQGHPDGALGARGPGRLSSARRWLWPSSQGGYLRPLRGCADSTDLLHWTFTPSLPALQMQSLEAAALFGWHSRKLERASSAPPLEGQLQPWVANGNPNWHEEQSMGHLLQQAFQGSPLVQSGAQWSSHTGSGLSSW